MTRPRLKHLALLTIAGTVAAGCGSEQISLDSADRGNDRIRDGAVIFADKCGGCHTLGETGTQGSAINVRNRTRRRRTPRRRRAVGRGGRPSLHMMPA